MTRTQLSRLHHLSAMSSHAQNTIDFYAGIMGLPLLKQTVNYDDPGSYHLYFGDPDLQTGSMTFFVWPGANPGQVGRGGTSRVGFFLSSEAELDRWECWLARHGIATTAETQPDESDTLRLEDPDGLRLELVGPDRDSEPKRTGDASSHVASSAVGPPRLGPIDQVAVIVSDIERSRPFYGETLGLQVASHESNARSHSVNLLQADAMTPSFRLGAGLTHHFALQIADENALIAWRNYLNDAGVSTTDVKDRQYFKSIYLRDPDGHVLEIATTGPGFTVDEPKAQLGQHLALPSWLEDRRSEIARRLPRLTAHPAPKE